MATNEAASPPTLHQFVVYAPDKTEPGTFEKRLSVRAKHLENAGALIGKGFISAQYFVYAGRYSDKDCIT